MKPATLITTIFLVFVSIAQLWRFVFQVHVTANGVVIPVWVSLIACIAMAALAFALWRENKA